MNTVTRIHEDRCERAEAVNDIASALFEAESALDQASAKAGLLLAGIPAARQRAGISPISGARAEAAVARAINALAEAKSELVRAHVSASRLADAMSATVAIGPLDKPEDDVPREPGGGGGG